MVKLWVMGVAIGLAPFSIKAEVISPAKALAMAQSALMDAGIHDAEPIAPSRALPECGGVVSTGPQSGQWTTISFSCEQPAWTRSLRTRTKTRVIESANTAHEHAAVPQVALGLIKSLAKDTILTADHIALVPASDIGPDQIFTVSTDLIGRRLNRALGAGHPILARHLQPDWKILLGQTVLITSGNESVSVAMYGRALANGTIGDLVDVENLTSGRVVSARVVRKDIVEVLLKPFGNGS